MAVLEKIRSKGVLLLIIIGGAMVLFIVSDFINSGSSFFQQQKANVAKINGDKIKIQDYADRMDQMNDVVKLEYGNNANNDEMSEQIHQMVWESTVAEKVIGDECNELGIMVTKDELSDMLFGNHISPVLRSSRLFVDENGQFNPLVVKQIIATIDNEEAAKNYSPEDLKSLRNTWKYWENAVKTSRLQEKYFGLLTKSMVVNPLEAKYSYDNTKTTVDILCTSKSYFTVADSTIAVTDKEIKELYEKKKEQYKRENRTADIQYIAYAIEPSKEDFDEAAAAIQEVRNELAAADAEEAAIIVNSNSEIPFIEGYVFDNQVDEALRGFAFDSKSDSVYGPVLFGNTFKMAKVLKRGIVAPDSVKLSVIALHEETEEKTAAKADSIEALLASGADFAAVAAENSLAQNARQGGEIGWVTDADMSANRDLAEKVFSTAEGKTFRMEENGVIQIFKVMTVGKKVAKVQLAVVEQTVTASSRTRTAIYNKLNQFSATNNKLDKFIEEAGKQSMPIASQKGLDINANKINGLKKMREAVKWVFDDKTKEGMVSNVFEGDEYIIAVAVEKLNDKGYRSLEEMRDVIVAEIRKDKKGNNFVAEMKGKTAAQLEAMGYHTDTITNVSFANSYAGVLGNEPQLVAWATMTEVGKTSEPIKGTNSAYIFTVLDSRETDRPFDEKEEATMLQAREAYSLGYFGLEALKKAANIEDFRYKYY